MTTELEKAILAFDELAKSYDVSEISIDDIKERDRILVLYGNSLENSYAYIYQMPSELKRRIVENVGQLLTFFSGSRYEEQVPFLRHEGEIDVENIKSMFKGRGRVVYASEKELESEIPNFEIAQNIVLRVYRIDPNSSLYNLLR